MIHSRIVLLLSTLVFHGVVVSPDLAKLITRDNPEPFF